MQKYLKTPIRDYIIGSLVILALASDFLIPDFSKPLLIFSLIGSIPTILEGLRGLSKLRINIEAFNSVALLISFGLGEIRSAAFIVLMLTASSILEWRTRTRSKDAVTELLSLKPRKALIETGSEHKEVDAENLVEGDVVVLKPGSRVPADGQIISGSAFINEAPVTGESTPVLRDVGDPVLSGTLVDSGAARIKVTVVGKNSTLERMAELIKEASQNKSKNEKLADKFASIFLPAVLVFGGLVYYFTRDAKITASVFLVACADDMAVAIPLAVSAALGKAAKHGVIIKGGEWLHVIGKIKSIVLDKTGTLTYGVFSLQSINIEPGVDHDKFWKLVAGAEKYSEHPVGRAIYKEAAKRAGVIPNHLSIETIKGVGLIGRDTSDVIAIGNSEIYKYVKADTINAERALKEHDLNAHTSALVFINDKFAGSFSIADTPRAEARQSMARIEQLGIEKIVMYTGDKPDVARAIGSNIGVKEVFAALKPEEKLRMLEKLPGPVAMVGDGINDAPSLARADVGIAMGSGGTAVAVEAADIVILTDNLERLPEIIELGRKTDSVIKWDIVIWVTTNVFGFALALTGILTPALAAFYNFLTDFLPLFNSARLYRDTK